MYTTKHFIKPDFIHLFVSKNDIQSMKIANMASRSILYVSSHYKNVYLYNCNDPA